MGSVSPSAAGLISEPGSEEGVLASGPSFCRAVFFSSGEGFMMNWKGIGHAISGCMFDSAIFHSKTGAFLVSSDLVVESNRKFHSLLLTVYFLV
ncbi:MAG: hypothetical protein ACI9TH_003972 [Kiritimatiellia bacterium]|jgi:hypothetical protein